MDLKTTAEARTKFLRGLYPRERWTPAQWAEKCRVLSAGESSEPGPYSFDRTPYWRFVCDLIAEIGVEEIVCLKGAQIGWSELCRNLLGYWVDLDPGPTLIVTADQQAADNFKIERVEPLMRETEAVRRHVTSRAWDETKYRVRFDTMWLFLTWAGSASGTKSRPIRNLIFEEPDDYPAFSGKGGDPLAKALKRVTTFSDKGQARILTGGTPTTRRGNIWKRWELCSVRYQYWVPCPHCNGYQTLQWKQVRWPELADEPQRSKRAERIKVEGLAYYECEHCREKIRDHHKARMLLRGVWASEDQAVTLDGRVVGPRKLATRIGIRLSALYSNWVKFGPLAADWIEAQGDPDALCDFINQRLAEPFEEQRAKTEPNHIREKVQRFDEATGGWKPLDDAPKPLIVPGWTRALIATADTQGNDERDGYFYYVIRAWGFDYRSQLIDFGVAHSKEELKRQCLDRPFETEGNRGLVTPQMLLVDSGGPRWSEVYQLSLSDPRIHPVKGDPAQRTWMLDERPQKRHGVVLWMIDSNQGQDLLHRLIHDPDKTRWMPHRDINDDYCRQLSSKIRIYNPTERREEWINVHKDDHLHDCEYYQATAAWRLGCGVAAPEPEADEPAEVGENAGQFVNGQGWSQKSW